MAVPAWEMASRAYSTWYRRPSGEKMVVCKRGKLHSRWLPLPAAAMMPCSGMVELQHRANLLGNRIFSTWWPG